MKTPIMTVKELRRAIRSASNVYIMFRFGLSEEWHLITKTQAYRLAGKLQENVTPERWEMFTGTFGEMDDGDLFLG